MYSPNKDTIHALINKLKFKLNKKSCYNHPVTTAFIEFTLPIFNICAPTSTNSLLSYRATTFIILPNFENQQGYFCIIQRNCK